MPTITLTRLDTNALVVEVEGLRYTPNTETPDRVRSEVRRMCWTIPGSDQQFPERSITVTESPDQINTLILAAVKREEEERTAQIDTARDLGIIIERLDETLRDIRHELSKK